MISNLSYRFRSNNFIKSRLGVVIIGGLLAACVIMFFPHLCRSTYKVTVTNKQIIKRNNVERYFIYTQTEKGNIKVFEDKNNLLELKFNSHDLYWAMAINKKYEVKAYGFGIPALSSYQNIVKAKGLDK